MAIAFPRSLLRERTARLVLTRRVISPGVGGSGNVTLLALDGGGLWELDYGSISLRTADHQRMWEALAAISDGGVTPFVVPYCGSRTAPWPLVGGEPLTSYGDIPHDDGTLFDDGSGYYQPVIDVEVIGTPALRDTSMTVRINYGSAFRGGELFSIYHPTAGYRFYRVVGVEEVVPDLDYTLTIRPPLREAVADGTVLDFDRPRCLMQLADPGAMDATWELRRFAQPSASFLEAPV